MPATTRAEARLTFAVLLLGTGLVIAERDSFAGNSKAWRIVNKEPIDVVWRLKTLAFFEDIECTRMHMALPNKTGSIMATDAAELTGAEHVFNLRSPRGWESEAHCDHGDCFLGFEWYDHSLDVRCIMVNQGEEGLHSSGISLQGREDGKWHEVAAWHNVGPGKSKLALSCPPTPEVPNARVVGCREESEVQRECTAVCEPGMGAVEPRLRCINGAWFLPECRVKGSMIRLVAQTPELIKPYWVIMHVYIYADEACTDRIEIEPGQAISSGEYVIKYASYHPKNIWDGSKSTSWASDHACTPGTCWVGYRFEAAPARPIKCVHVLHPEGKVYHAESVAYEVLGEDGWAEDADVVVKLSVEKSEL